MAKLPGADKDEGGQSEGAAHDEAALVTIHGSQDARKLLRVSGGSHVFPLGRGDGSSEVSRGVAFSPPRGHRISEHLSAGAPGTMGRLHGPACLDAADHVQQLGGRDVRDRTVPNPGEDVAHEASEDAIPVFFSLGRSVFFYPPPPHALQAFGRRVGPGGPLCLPVLAGVHTLAQQLPRLVPALPRLLQPHVGIDTQRETLLLAVEAVFQAPPPAPAWGDLQVEAALIVEPNWLHTCLDFSQCSIGQGHGGNS